MLAMSLSLLFASLAFDSEGRQVLRTQQNKAIPIVWFAGRTKVRHILKLKVWIRSQQLGRDASHGGGLPNQTGYRYETEQKKGAYITNSRKVVHISFMA